MNANVIRFMKLAAKDVIGVTINRVVCTEPPVKTYTRRAHFILDVDDNQLLAIGTGTIQYGTLPDGIATYPAAAWQHSVFVDSTELQRLVQRHQIKRLIRTRANGYDASMVVLSNNIVLGNCDTGGQRLLYIRSHFEEKYESETEYWDYFTSQPVDHLGNDVDGVPREPFRVSWV